MFETLRHAGHKHLMPSSEYAGIAGEDVGALSVGDIIRNPSLRKHKRKVNKVNSVYVSY